MSARRPTPMRSRVAPQSLRPAPAFITPQLVAAVLDVADRLRAQAPAPRPAPVAPVRVHHVKPTTTIDNPPAPRVSSPPAAARQEPTAERTPPPARAVGVRPSFEAAPGRDPNLGAPSVIMDRAREVIAANKARQATSKMDMMAVAGSLRVSAPAPTFSRPRPLVEKASAAIAFLRGQCISVSVASSGRLGTRWNVSGHASPFTAEQLVQLAVSKGFGA